MDRGVKIALAALVFLVGTSFAFLYRRPMPERTVDKSGPASQLVLRGPRWNGPQPTYKTRSTPTGAKTELPSVNPRLAASGHDTSAQGSAPVTATVLAPIDTGQPPPRLAKVFPRHGNPDDLRWGAAIGHRLPVSNNRPPEGPRIHRVVDGDTLDDLAKRFLGDAARAGEIFDANRHILSDPNALPIGIELTIPSGQSPPVEPAGILPDKPVVPVVQPG